MIGLVYALSFYGISDIVRHTKPQPSDVPGAPVPKYLNADVPFLKTNLSIVPLSDQLFWKKPNSTMLVRQASSLVMLVPYVQKHGDRVIHALNSWSIVGDPCPLVRQHNLTTVDLVFWFNKDFEDTQNFSSSFRHSVHRALEEHDNRRCFGKVKFLSAKLELSEDVYPIGPSYQWYNAFLSNVTGLTGLYDYMFWAEHDVYPIKEGFIDKLLEEVTFQGDFYVKGSIHRCLYLFLIRV
jgi:hypothetical protein